MPSANEEYLDAALRHSMELRGFTRGELQRLNKLLERSDRELSIELRKALADMGVKKGAQYSFKTKRFKRMIEELSGMRAAVMAELRSDNKSTFDALATLEAQKELDILNSVVPVEFSFAAASGTLLREIVNSRPFQGRILKDYYTTLSANDKRRLRESIQLGMAQGESINDIVARVVGTRGAQFKDGALAITRREAEAIVRTAVNHISNGAREAVWAANSGAFSYLMWVSTLDGRTTLICASRDGKVISTDGSPIPAQYEALVPQGARPPAHYNCRSLTVVVFSEDGLVGNRPFVVDTRTRSKRTIDFREEAKRRGVSVGQVRNEWKAENVGRVPAKTTFNQFLRRQDAAFQDSYLGKRRGAAYRAGDLNVDQFVDRYGKTLTLKQLADSSVI